MRGLGFVLGLDPAGAGPGIDVGSFTTDGWVVGGGNEVRGCEEGLAGCVGEVF